jgi:hypothetical protein
MSGPNQQPDLDRIDLSHASDHHLEGSYKFPITQKIVATNGRSVQLGTPVDSLGNVGESTFNFN